MNETEIRAEHIGGKYEKHCIQGIGLPEDRKDVVAYLNAALEDGDPAVLLEALRDVAQVRGGMGALAKAAGVSRERLYQTQSRRGNPKIETIMEFLRALGLKFTVAQCKAA